MDVADIFSFLFLVGGGGEGESEAPGPGGDQFLIENPRREGGVCRREGPRGPGG